MSSLPPNYPLQISYFRIATIIPHPMIINIALLLSLISAFQEESLCDDQIASCASKTRCVIEGCRLIIESSTISTFEGKDLVFLDVAFYLGNLLPTENFTNGFELRGQSFTFSHFTVTAINYKDQNSSLPFHIYADSLTLDSTNMNETSVFHIARSDNTLIKNSRFTANYILLNSTNLSILNTSIQAFQRLCKGSVCNCTQGSCIDPNISSYKSFQTSLDNPIENYTLALSSQSVMITNSTIQGSSIGIYGDLTLSQDSTVSADGQGCEPEFGLGCGFNDWMIGQKLKCGSSGASHGSQGTSPTSGVDEFSFICQMLIPRRTYGNPFNPIFEGSGGGGTFFAGEGGGVIYIQGEKIEINGRISADGTRPQRNDSDQYGAGSGGSIQIRGPTYQLPSINGNGTISAEGGSKLREESHSGEGGGGRILLWASETNLSVTAGKDRSSGSIVGSFCVSPKGLLGTTNRMGPFCQACPGGYFNFLTGYVRCIPCLNQDPNVESFQEGREPFCKIRKCKTGFEEYNSRCISKWEKTLAGMGGENVLFSLICLITIIIVQVIILILKNRKQRNRRKLMATEISSQIIDDAIGWAQGTSFFVVEDLPYHVHRLYVMGNNTLFFPWYLPETTNVMNQEIPELIKQFNIKARYTRMQRHLLLFLRYFYYPMYIQFLRYCQVRKFNELTFLFKFYQKVGIYNLKLTQSFDYTLAFIDIVDYSKNILNWNKNTQFPVTLVLSGKGNFLYPWQINIKDPLVRSLSLSFQKQRLFDYSETSDLEDANSPEEEADEFSNFEEFLMKFNKYALHIDTRKSQDEFIKSCYSLFEFIDDANNDIFNRKQILLDVCFHILSSKQSYIIMLSTRRMNDLQTTLRELHSILNFRPQFSVKVSINFDQTDLSSARYFDNQIVINTINDMNEQISIYKRYEDDKEELNNLKLQMQRKIESDGILTPLIEIRKRQDFGDTHKLKGNFSSKFMIYLKRVTTISFSYITRYRTTHEDRLLTIKLIALGFMAFSLDTFYILLIVSDFSSQGELGILEICFQLVVFPLSWLGSLIYLVVWLINPSKNHLGKQFLLYNFCALVNLAITLIIGLIQEATLFINNKDIGLILWYLTKFYMFFHYMLMGYYGTKYLQD